MARLWSLDMGDEEDSSGARGTKLQVARDILAWRGQARSLRRRNAHRFPKIGAACAMGYVDVFGCHLGNELLRSCLAETRMFTSMTNDAFFITGSGRVYFGVGGRPDCIARQRPKASRDNPTGVINMLRCVAAVAHGTA